jgi:hypothetical protein
MRGLTIGGLTQAAVSGGVRMKRFLLALSTTSALALPTATASACPVGKLCGQTIIATIKQTDASGSSRENEQRLFITPQGEVQTFEWMGNQQVAISCTRAGKMTSNTCPGRSCIESDANGILDMAERRMTCRYEWNGASQTLTMVSNGALRLVRRSLGTPGVTRENFPKHDGVTVLAQVQTFEIQGVNTISFSGGSCRFAGRSSGTGVVRLMNEWAQPVTSNSAGTSATLESTSCEVRRGRLSRN